MPTDEGDPPFWGHSEAAPLLREARSPSSRVAHKCAAAGAEDPPSLVHRRLLIDHATNDQREQHPVDGTVRNRLDSGRGGREKHDPPLPGPPRAGPVQVFGVRFDHVEPAARPHASLELREKVPDPRTQVRHRLPRSHIEQVQVTGGGGETSTERIVQGAGSTPSVLGEHGKEHAQRGFSGSCRARRTESNLGERH
jgi:hypothetical protein